MAMRQKSKTIQPARIDCAYGRKIDSDDEPTRAIRRKKQASMVLAAKDVKDGEVDAMLSAGIQVPCRQQVSLVSPHQGVETSGLITLPTVDGRGYDMLDLGANTENTPRHLHRML